MIRPQYASYRAAEGAKGTERKRVAARRSDLDSAGGKDSQLGRPRSSTGGVSELCGRAGPAGPRRRATGPEGEELRPPTHTDHRKQADGKSIIPTSSQCSELR
jgi:hypothetical protein